MKLISGKQPKLNICTRLNFDLNFSCNKNSNFYLKLTLLKALGTRYQFAIDIKDKLIVDSVNLF